MGDASRSLGDQAPGDAYGYQGDALDALREGLQGMMQQMYAQQPGQQGQQMGGRTTGDRDPLGRPQRTEGPDLGQTVKVPDEIDVERARRILEAIRQRLGERFRPRYELDYLERLLTANRRRSGRLLRSRGFSSVAAASLTASRICCSVKGLVTTSRMTSARSCARSR